MYFENGALQMRLIPLQALQADMIIGRTIWNDARRPLIQKGTQVSLRMITRLEQLNVPYVYIDDSLSKGIEIEETISLETRTRAIANIESTFSAVRGAEGKNIAYILDKQTKQLTTIVDDLISTIMQDKELLMVLSDAFIYDEYLYQHSFQVTLYSIAIAKKMKFNEADIRTIGLGAMLHDIGKITIPKEVLLKPGRLTDDEYKMIQLHAQRGFDILRNLHSISLIIAHCAFQHHERLDGSGYPRGIKEDEIHRFAKVIAVADVFDALSTDRVYRKKMLPTECFAILDNEIGTAFDGEVVQALKDSVMHYPNGVIVRLSNGNRGVVAKQNSHAPNAPNLRMFEENNKVLNATYELDLTQCPTIFIEAVELDYVMN